MHRLNRTEYTNAVRDLLAIEVDGRALLPPDDSGYGFDNIGDVLSVSPGLMERYMLAAGQEPHKLLSFRPDRQYDVLCARLVDYGGVPPGWEMFLRTKVVSLLQEGKNILAFCYAGQGRTGTFLASLVAILEPDCPDPIEEVRHRYSEHAVETVAQARAIFAIAGRPMPAKYKQLH